MSKKKVEKKAASRLRDLFKCIAHETKHANEVRELYLRYTRGRISRLEMNAQLRHLATTDQLKKAVQAFAAAMQTS